MTQDTSPVLLSKPPLGSQGLARAHLASLTRGKRRPQEDPETKANSAGTTLSHARRCEDWPAVLPGSAAWLPCSTVPGTRPQHHMLSAQMWGFHQELCSLAILSLQVALTQEQSGVQGEGMGQSPPLPMPDWRKHCQK